MAAAGCGDSSSSGEGPKVAKPADSAEGVTLRVGVQKDGIRPLLEKSGVLEGVPYKIEYSVFAFGPPLVEAAGADKIDVAAVGSTPPIFGAAAKSDFRVVATNQFANDRTTTCLTKDRSITQARGPEGQERRRGQGQLGARAAAEGAQAERAQQGRRRRSRSCCRPTGWPRSRAADRRVVGVGSRSPARASRPAGAASPAVRPTSTAPTSRSPRPRRSRTPSAPPRSRTTSTGCAAYEWAAEHQDEFAEAWSEETGLPLDDDQGGRPGEARSRCER